MHRMSARIRTRKTRRPSGNRAGFTLVELLVALMVFAVGMLGLAATAGSVTRMITLPTSPRITSTTSSSASETPAREARREARRGLSMRVSSCRPSSASYRASSGTTPNP